MKSLWQRSRALLKFYSLFKGENCDLINAIGEPVLEQSGQWKSRLEELWAISTLNLCPTSELTGLETLVTITRTNFIRSPLREYETVQFPAIFGPTNYVKTFPSCFLRQPCPSSLPFRDTRAVITKSTFPVKIAECK